MKKLVLLSCILALSAGHLEATDLPTAYNEVDQVLWVVSDVETTIVKYRELGFDQFKDLGTVEVKSWTDENVSMARLVCANLGGAHVNWIQPLEGESIFNDFLIEHGDAAMSLVHRFFEVGDLKDEIGRLDELGISILDKISIETSEGELAYVLMNTEAEGKYVLGFTYADKGLQIHTALCDDNQLELSLNQYAFAIKDPEPVSDYWKKIGLPELEINYPELGDPMYYG
ncbi:MAG: VOC family protein, partial [Bacteroidales bacterium]|nr:VOC family protein [Bacteroidales bacterium]